MNFIMVIYTEVLYRPLFNALVLIYNQIPWEAWAIGLAIIILTILLKLALYSMSARSILAQRDMQKLQPRMNEIKDKYKNDKEKQSREMMKFYKENKVNPFSSCLPLLIQLPILIALYRVFQHGLINPEELNTVLYPFVANPGNLNPYFLGIDLAVPNIVLAIIAGASQFLQSWLLLKMKTEKEKIEEAERKKNQKKKKTMDFSETASNMTKQMVYIMPLVTVFIAMSLPSGLAFYWIATSLFGVFQQWLIMKKKEKLDLEEANTPQLPSGEGKPSGKGKK